VAFGPTLLPPTPPIWMHQMAISYPRYHVKTTKCWGNNIREMVVLKIKWEKIREHGLGHFGKVEGD